MAGTMNATRSAPSGALRLAALLLGVAALPALAAESAGAAPSSPAPSASPAAAVPAPAPGATAAAAKPADDAPATFRDVAPARVERIVQEDDQVRIEETRVRGLTQKVVVRNKDGKTPEYEILLGDSGRDIPTRQGADRGNAGQRVWRLISF